MIEVKLTVTVVATYDQVDDPDLKEMLDDINQMPQEMLDEDDKLQHVEVRVTTRPTGATLWNAGPVSAAGR